MWTKEDYINVKERYNNLKNQVYKTIDYLNAASNEMSNTLDIGNYFQVNNHSADNGKFWKTREDMNYLIYYLRDKILPYLDEEIYKAVEKINELTVENIND